MEMSFTAWLQGGPFLEVNFIVEIKEDEKIGKISIK